MVASLKIKGKLNKKIIKGYAIPTVLIIFEIYFLIILSAVLIATRQTKMRYNKWPSAIAFGME